MSFNHLPLHPQYQAKSVGNVASNPGSRLGSFNNNERQGGGSAYEAANRGTFGNGLRASQRSPRHDYAMPPAPLGHQTYLEERRSYKEIQQTMNKKQQVIDEDSDEDCQAIPFIKFLPEERKFEIDKEAEQFLKQLVDTKLGVVAVCGKYRTGKSYLMNKLFVEQYFQKKKAKMMQKQEQDIKKQGFTVSPTINACTKGLWLWKKVIKAENSANGQEMGIIVVDTEGLGAYDEDENHDAKIFLLALLLSSLLIYNSVGTIDENALNSLSLVINLSKKIQLKKNGNDSQEDIDELAKMFPSFLWVLRDFALRLVDNDGNKLTPKQYLESALREQKGVSDAVESKNRLRRLLAHFFQERDCCTLVRPTEQEKDLQSLIKLPDSELRVEFVEQMAKLKQKVMIKAKVKMLNGHGMNGPMLVELANSYIKALNDGEVPVIENAWTNVCHFEQERAFKEAVTCYQTLISVKLKQNRSPDIDVKAILKEIRDEALRVLKKDFLGEQKQFEEYSKKLCTQFKNDSKSVIADVRHRMDVALTEVINKQIADKLESKIRRCDPSISSFEILLELSQQLLGSLIMEHHPAQVERVEFLFRQILQAKLPKWLETVHAAFCRTPVNTSIKTMEHKVKLAEDDVVRYREERLNTQRESFEKSALLERERQEVLRREKVLEIKMADLEAKYKEAESNLKYYRAKQTKDINLQTEASFQPLVYERFVQACPNTRDDGMMTSEDRGGVVIQSSPPKRKSTIVETPQYFEQNMKLLRNILDSLGRDKNQEVQKSFLSEILQKNQLLSKAVEQGDRRCQALERKLDQKSRYQTLVQNCQRLQCAECSKLYTPALFQQHYAICKRTSNASIGGGLPNRNSNTSCVPSGVPIVQVNVPQLPEFEIATFCNKNLGGAGSSEDEGSNVIYEGGEASSICEDVSAKQMIAEIFQPQTKSPISQLSNQQFAVKVVNITVHQPQINTPRVKEDSDYKSPAFRRDQEDLALQVIEVNLCLIHGGIVSYLQRSLSLIKNLMARIQKRVFSTTEQSQIARWIIEVERAEKDQSQFHVIATIVESFFSQVYQKIVENHLHFNKHVIVDDINCLKGPQYFYVNELVDFFEIEEDSQDLLKSVVSVQTRLHGCSRCSAGARNPMDSLEIERYKGIEDEVLMQTPNQELIHVQQASRIEKQSPNGKHNNGGYLTTIQLDGEVSIQDNSNMQYLSFFSKDEGAALLRKEVGLVGESVASSIRSGELLNNQTIKFDYQQYNIAFPQPYLQQRPVQNYFVDQEQNSRSTLQQPGSYPLVQEILINGKKSIVNQQQRKPIKIAEAVTQKHQAYFNSHQGAHSSIEPTDQEQKREKMRDDQPSLISFYKDI